jgi:heptosyltransferase II
MKVLIIQTAFLGDVILATPIIEKLKEQDKNCTIDFLLRKGNESLFENHPHINKLIIFDKKNKNRNLFPVIRLIRAGSYDYTINIHRSLRTGFITILSGAKFKIGFNKNPLSFLFTFSVKHQFTKKEFRIHEVSRNLSLIKKLGNNEFIRPRLYPSEIDYNVTFVEGEYICIAPGTVWNTKQFPAEKWVELISKLPDKFAVYLIGSETDSKLCDQILKKNSNRKVENRAGKFTLLQSAALIQKAKMTFANDSAVVHIASAMNAPIAVIYCSTIPDFGFEPLSDDSTIIEIDRKLDCRPCGLHGKTRCPKNHFKCSEVNIDKIISTISPSL